ncbi:adenylyltransferase/cytidyltransferase family protein [Candidatus Bathycorpusculum sp.]|jgi:FAD synthetase|uniref:adenylyltransferase/cytidyltransferase family protein n=1 Tax=Candidatus Bathycorpusculum sp. TaxID=2994959 RepID=UPI00281E175A|nr:FAD synthase [Candidatus Termitimicrobium sp.]MCL2432058.1 FAD synthase [Candidatus Termitimicrobium sp.]MDR0471571.1 FAD synthase [Nitrososphaerota archaeon]
MASQTTEPNRKTVIASGVFDLLHLGHVRFLEDAKKAGGTDTKLIVIVARDSTAEKLKGKKPIMSEDQRRALVESLKVVDEAVLGFEGLEIGEVIKKIQPDIIALGYDQTGMEQEIKEYITGYKRPVLVVRIDKFGENTLDSSSKIKQQILDKFASSG